MAILQGKKEKEGNDDKRSLILSNQGLQDDDFALVCLSSNLVTIDLSRNSLGNLPSPILQLSHLIRLDISRNSLRSLPTDIKNLSNLEELNALSNHLRLRLLPLPELASLSKLKLLDLRYNSKLKKQAQITIQNSLAPSVEVRCTIPVEHPSNNNKLSACDRDPNLLQSQLEPLSTPQLRKRLERTFGVVLDEQEAFDRNIVMHRLVTEYEKIGSRKVRQERGALLPDSTIQELLQEMEAIDWPHTTRERPKIKAEYYVILQKPGSGQADSKRTRIETAKLQRYQRIFDAAVRALKQIDPDYADRFTALAVTKNFKGSPHIDTLNTGPFAAISLGDFTSGGKIAVECSPTMVAEINTHNRLAKVDGRFPHWVTPYETGTRYSLIYYVTSGHVEKQTTAIYPPKDHNEEKDGEWIPPPLFEL